MQKLILGKLKAWKCIFVILLYLLLVVILWISCIQYINRYLRKQTIESLELMSNHHTAWLDSIMVSKLSVLENIADSLALDGYDFLEATKHAIDLKNSLGVYEVEIIDANGESYTSDLKQYNASYKKEFQIAVEGVPYISGILQDNTRDLKVTTYGVPILDFREDGEIIGALLITEIADNFLEKLNIPIFQTGGYTCIIDHNGVVIEFANQIENYKNTNLIELIGSDSKNEKNIEYVKDAIEKREKFSTTYFNGEDNFVIGSPLVLNNWYLVNILPDSEMRSLYSSTSYFIGLVFSIVFLLTMTMLAYIIIVHRKKQKYLKNVAYIDSFTGLYNKNYLNDNIQDIILKASDKKIAFVIYNIQNFKMFNELYGTNTGNLIIDLISVQLKKVAKYKGEVVLHGYGDEFALLCFYQTKKEMEQRIKVSLEKMKRVVSKKLQIAIEVSVGIYELESEKYPFEQIYNYANMAKNKNKESTSEQFTYYSKKLVESDLEKRQLEDHIRKGISNKEFRAWFQPQFDYKTKEIIGCEALVRWYTDDGRILSPYHFIEASEKANLIGEIDRLIFEDVCIKINQWREKGYLNVPVSVNLSRAYLNSIDMLEELKNIANYYQIPSNLINLEITESAIVDDEKRLRKVVQQMHDFGFKVALDDFGVGYSSLMSINSMKFDVLKIDKSFVDAIDTNNGKEIMKYTVNLGRQLGMDVIIEGVETKEQYEYLKLLGKISLQGYYFSKPVDSDVMEKMLIQYNSKK